MFDLKTFDVALSLTLNRPYDNLQMLQVFVFIIIALIALVLEFELRRRAGRQPNGLKAYFQLLNKGASPNKPITALLFALNMTFIFYAWEAFIRFLVQATSHWSVMWLGALIVAFHFYKRGKLWLQTLPEEFHYQDIKRSEIALFAAGMGLLCGAQWSLALVGWIFFRARILPPGRPY